jgi:hypothetical protein
MVQLTALFTQALVLLPGFGIRHKRFHLLADALKLGLLDDGFAQFPCFLEDHVLSLNICFHKYQSICNSPRRRRRRMECASIQSAMPAINCNFGDNLRRKWMSDVQLASLNFFLGIRAADAKEVGLGEPSKETYRHPNQIQYNSKALSGVVNI